jgi:hypothetical protein
LKHEQERFERNYKRTLCTICARLKCFLLSNLTRHTAVTMVIIPVVPKYSSNAVKQSAAADLFTASYLNIDPV